MAAQPQEPKTASPARLIAFYVVLAALTVTVAIVVIAQGKDEHPQPAIAGGYDAAAPNPCLGKVTPPPKGPPLPATAPAQPAVTGPSFDIKQSGQFVNIANTAGTLSGQLRLHDGPKDATHRLTGTVDCVNGKSLDFEGTATPGTKGIIAGKLGGAPVTANLKRDAPDPGTPKPRAPNSIAGIYKLSPRSTCFGGNFQLKGSGSSYAIHAKAQNLGTVAYTDTTGAVNGDVACTRGGTVRLKGLAVDRNLNNLQLVPLDAAKPVPGTAAQAKPVLTTPSGVGPGGERFTGTKQRESFGNLVAAFFLAAAIVMVVARLFGIVATRIGQPRVMGEVVAGICLGPSLLGWISPDLQAAIFPSDILPAFGVAANLGLIFYMFLVGLEIDLSKLKGRIPQAAAISNASVALPMLLGLAIALPLYKVLAPDKKFVAFALFMGVSMSITAFPVLARILVERRMLKRPVGALTLACAAIDDVTAWFLIALATAVAVAGTFGDVALTIAEAMLFCAVMAMLVRPLLGRVSTAFDAGGGQVHGGWVWAIFAGILLSAYATEEIGIALIFGGFVMGMVMPRNAGLTENVTRRIEDFVVILLLPMFFAYTGLKTNIGLLDRSELWWITLALIAIAITGKLFGAYIAARVSGFNNRSSLVIGTLMNTRGLTELIVLNLALEKGVISDALYASLIIMALVTTFMAGPPLNRLDPENRFGAPIEDELEDARKQSAADLPWIQVPERSILVAPRSDEALEQLLAVAMPLARSEPPRELILARLLEPTRARSARGGLQSESAALQQTMELLNDARGKVALEAIAARSVAFTSPNPGRDLARLAEREDVDLVLIDGHRPLVGEPVPLGDARAVLADAPCDVAVLVAREGAVIAPGPESPIFVPFGGAEHDWSALELGAWIAASTKAPLRLLGAAGQTDETASLSRMLADASLLVQQFASVTSEPVLVDRGRDHILEAAEGAGLLVLGLSDRWKQEGLGETRSAIAREARSPVLFVRRGTRPGALAPRTDVTRFAWSSPNIGGDLPIGSGQGD